MPYGKIESARRSIPLTPRAAVLLEMRSGVSRTQWVFPAPTKSGHIEKSSLRKQHLLALSLAKLEPLALYAFRPTCLTRWAEHMDPYTLAYLAGHSGFSPTKQYVHSQAETLRAAMERARAAQGGHSDEKAAMETSPLAASKLLNNSEIFGRGEWIRTTDLLVPNQAL